MIKYLEGDLLMEFQLNPEELKKLEQWIKSLPGQDANLGAIGGRLTFSFTPNNLGCVIKVIDNVSKQELDLTEYESW